MHFTSSVPLGYDAPMTNNSYPNTKRLLLAGALAITTVTSACQSQPATPTSTTKPAPCVAVAFQSEAGWGYGGGAWAEESGDGKVLGYAIEEDSNIYTTEACARSMPLYD